MSVDPNDQSQQGNAPQEPPAQADMSQEIQTHRKTLEGIKNKLHPGKQWRVLNTDVETYNRDISSIFDYMKKIEGTDNVFNYITSISVLNLKLREIMRKLQGALNSWNMSKEGTPSEKSEAFDVYIEHLDICYDLLEEALNFFKPVDQAQQEKVTEGNDETVKKTP